MSREARSPETTLSGRHSHPRKTAVAPSIRRIASSVAPTQVGLSACVDRELSHSHSIVAGGLELMSYTTRFTPGTSLTMRELILPSTSYGIFAQSAVIPSSDFTARMATTLAYVRPSPMTQTERSGVRMANDCH